MAAGPTTKTTPTRKYSARMPRPERREQLLDAALAIVVDRGFGDLTMEGVAREADIAKTVVYDAFGDREAMLDALLMRHQERALALVASVVPEPPYKEGLGTLFVAGMTAFLEGVRDDPGTWRLIVIPQEGMPPAVRARVDKHREDARRQLEPIAAWLLGKAGAPDLDPELMSHLIRGNAEYLARMTIEDPKRFSPDRLAGFAHDGLRALGAPID